MNRKILTISILAVLMIITISYATAINTTKTETKESPLYKIRTRRAITEKLNTILENIKTKFLGERIFFLPSITRLKQIFVQSNTIPTVPEQDTCGWQKTCMWGCVLKN